MIISKRQKIAEIERSTGGIGVSTTARKYLRAEYSKLGLDDLARMRNAELNELVAQDFTRAEPVHRFMLKDGTQAEIRKSNQYYYITAMRNNSYDIIAVQPQIKEVTPERRYEWTAT